MGKINNYEFGGGGVNLVKDPLQLADNESTQLQNAEYKQDTGAGGQGSLSMRGGLQALTSALGATILGLVGLPLNTTYTRTLYAALGNAAVATWGKTTDGTTWTTTSTPYGATNLSSDYTKFGTTAWPSVRRMAQFKTFMLSPGRDYVSDTATPANNTAVDLDLWDGTTASKIFRLQVGTASSDGNFPFAITDMIVNNGKIYFCCHDPVNSGTMKGRVFSLDLTTGVVKQIATGFGSATGLMTGGAPSCLCWYQGKLWVGLHNGDGTANAGKVVWCYPDIDTAWTVDTSTLNGYVQDLCVFRGDLYAGLRGNATNDAAVFKRAASTGVWTSSDTMATSGSDYYQGFVNLNDTTLYVVVYSDGGADIELIRAFDGTTWSTSRDVAANDCTGGIAQQVGNGIVYGSDVFYVFAATADGNSDGFIMRLHSGTWSKVSTGNYTGRLAVLLTKS